MMSGLTRYSSWLVLLLAFATWSGVGYFAWVITAVAEEHAARIASVEQEKLEHESALRLHTLARETKEGRMQLDELAEQSIIEILDAVEAISKDARIPLEIGQAPSILANEAPIVKTASFAIESRGTFGQISQAIALLESFPIPSSVDELHIERLQSADVKAKGAWRLVARMRFFTTAEIPL